MHPSTPKVAFLLAISILFLPGCNQSTEDVVAVSTPVKKTSEELAATINECLDSARVTHKTLQSNFKQFRVDILRGRVNDGVAAVTELLASDASAEQIEAAQCAESELLFYGALNCNPDFVNQLSDCAERYMQQDRTADPCRLAVGRWLHYRYASQDVPLGEALKMITDYAHVYPEGNETAELFNALAKRLIKVKKLKQANKVLQAGTKALASPDALASVRSTLDKHMKRERKNAAKNASDRRMRARVKSVLGGREKGYFVVYSEVNTKSWRRRCDYSVCHNIESVVEYAKMAEKTDWKWEVVHAYPDSNAGLAAATGKMRELVKKNTTTMYGS